MRIYEEWLVLEGSKKFPKVYNRFSHFSGLKHPKTSKKILNTTITRCHADHKWIVIHFPLLLDQPLLDQRTFHGT